MCTQSDWLIHTMKWKINIEPFCFNVSTIALCKKLPGSASNTIDLFPKALWCYANHYVYIPIKWFSAIVSDRSSVPLLNYQFCNAVNRFKGKKNHVWMFILTCSFHIFVKPNQNEWGENCWQFNFFFVYRSCLRSFASSMTIKIRSDKNRFIGLMQHIKAIAFFIVLPFLPEKELSAASV